MPEPAYLAMMDDSNIRSAFAVQDAADALIALGWPVIPPTQSQPRWQIGNDLLTGTELLVFASFVVIVPKVKRSRQ
jgi:hypothetical protein